jgi:outer membrane protein assembly factor BamB
MAGPKAAAKVKWSFATGDKIFSSPVIAKDGTIYIGSDDKSLYAIDPTGAKKWAFATDGGIDGVPAIGADGTIYVGSAGGVFAVSPDGAMKWLAKSSAQVIDVTIGPDGTVYGVGSDGALRAISPAGVELWKYQLSSGSFAPAIDGIGNLFVVGGSTFAALKPDGTATWAIDTKASYLRSTTLVGSGLVLTPDGDAVRARSVADGSVSWSFAMGSNTDSAVSVGPDGTLYVGNGFMGTEKRLYALTPDGKEKWHFDAGQRVFSTPAIGSDGSAYFGTDDMVKDNFVGLNADGTLRFSLTLAPITGSPAMGADGTLYVGAKDGKLYAVGE